MKIEIRILCGFAMLVSISNSHAAIDCRNLSNQTQINQCTNLQLDIATDDLNITYAKYREKLTSGEKLRLKNAELQWIKFRDLDCEFVAPKSEGGSMYPSVLAQCLIKLTDARNAELKSMMNCENGVEPACD